MNNPLGVSWIFLYKPYHMIKATCNFVSHKCVRNKSWQRTTSMLAFSTGLMSSTKPKYLISAALRVDKVFHIKFFLHLLCKSLGPVIYVLDMAA